MTLVDLGKNVGLNGRWLSKVLRGMLNRGLVAELGGTGPVKYRKPRLSPKKKKAPRVLAPHLRVAIWIKSSERTRRRAERLVGDGYGETVMSEENGTTAGEGGKKTYKKRFRVAAEVELMAARTISRRLLELPSDRRNAVLRMAAEYVQNDGGQKLAANLDLGGGDELV